MRYFTGTTLECVYDIFKTGALLTKPPHRVWKNYSDEFVYFVPFNEQDEEERGEALVYAFQQADFAVYELNGTRRVILEIEGLDEEMVEKDPDCESIGAVRYPFDVELHHIKAIHLEQRDVTESIHKYIAIFTYLRKVRSGVRSLDYDAFLWNQDEEENEYSDVHKDDWKHELNRLDVKHLDFVVNADVYSNEDMENHYMDLREEIEDPDYHSYTLDEWKMVFSDKIA